MGAPRGSIGAIFYLNEVKIKWLAAAMYVCDEGGKGGRGREQGCKGAKLQSV